MKTFVDVISENAERHPNKTVLVDEFGSYTYQELDRLSNGVAAKLIGQGIGAGDIVPILMTRSKAFVAAFIGVMKSGAAFVPLDINYPEERIKSIEESVEAKIVIDDEWMKDVAPSDEFINNSKPDDMAFIIFTSGSTGTPKGVVHTHKSAVAMAKAAIASCSLNAETNYSTILGCNFIGGLHNYISYLSLGASLFIAPDRIRKDADALSTWMCNNNIEAMHCNPSFGKILLENYNLPIKYIEMGSEKLFPISKTSAKIAYQYGCSEFAPPAIINTNIHLNESAPIGKPVDGVTAFIVTDEKELVNNNEIGELCLVGPQMASGYWKMPELTAEKFVHCPFLPGDVKMYKTGDLARYREDGNIELVGRKDFQIKIRGFRIEPGEIENVAVKFGGIDTVVVVAKEMGAEKQLVLYYTSNEQVDEPKLKEYLSRYLADYMVPNFYVRLDEMPRNANGKIDRKALPVPQVCFDKEKKPTTKLERVIFDVVAKQIGIQDFGIDDNFVNLGLTSIGSMYMISNLCKIGYSVQLSALKANVTVRTLAHHIESKIVSSENTEQIVQDVDLKILTNDDSSKSPLSTPKIKIVYRVLHCLAAITKLHPVPVFQFLKINSISNIANGNVLIPSRYCILEIDKSATINKGGISILGSRFHFAKSHLETRLMLRENSCLNLCNTRIGYGADIEVFENSSLSFGNNTSSNIGLTIICQDRITIGKNVGIGRDVTIRDNNGGHFVDLPNYRNATPVEIGDGSWLCSKCTIMSGVTVGEGAVIGANSFVTHNIPAHSLASGHPAEVLTNDVSFKF